MSAPSLLVVKISVINDYFFIQLKQLPNSQKWLDLDFQVSMELAHCKSLYLENNCFSLHKVNLQSYWSIEEVHYFIGQT